MENAKAAAEDALATRDALVFGCRYKRELLTSLASWSGSLNPSQDIHAIETVLPQSNIIIWTQEMFELARNGSEAFLDTASPSWDVSEAPQLWVFERFSVQVDCEQLGIPPGSVMREVLLVPTSSPRHKTRLILIAVCYDDTDHLPRFRVFELGEGRPIGDAITAIICAGRAFMQLTLTSREVAVLPRSTRRRMQKANQPIPDIRIIQLRQRQPSENGDGATREYHHKWIVKGHWRRLHEPRKADGVEVTFVHAYVKGPQDAPLIQPRESVYVVAR